jgi:hypothetical protein
MGKRELYLKVRRKNLGIDKWKEENETFRKRVTKSKEKCHKTREKTWYRIQLEQKIDYDTLFDAMRTQLHRFTFMLFFLFYEYSLNAKFKEISIFPHLYSFRFF